MTEFGEKYITSMDEMIERGASVSKSMEKKTSENKRAKDIAVKVGIRKLGFGKTAKRNATADEFHSSYLYR